LPRIKNFLTFSTIHANLAPERVAKKNEQRPAGSQQLLFPIADRWFASSYE